MFTWEQFSWVWDHFGILGIAIVFIILVIAFWPKIKEVLDRVGKFIDTVNIVAGLPDWQRSVDDSITKILNGNTKLSDDLATNAKKLDDHLEDAKTKTDLLTKVDRRLTSIEDKAGAAAAKAEVAADKAEIAAAQAQNNGGSTMKDKVDKVPDTLEEIKRMLRKLTGEEDVA